MSRALLFVALIVAVFEARAASPVSSATLQKFLNKNKPCYVWAFGGGRDGADVMTMGEVFCIFDGVTGEGTLSEEKGCMIAIFTPENGFYDTDAKGFGPVLTEMACSPESVRGFFEVKKVANSTLSAFGASGAGTNTVIGGNERGARAFVRVLCKVAAKTMGGQSMGLDCKDGEQAEKIAKPPLGKKNGEKPKKPSDG